MVLVGDDESKNSSRKAIDDRSVVFLTNFGESLGLLTNVIMTDVSVSVPILSIVACMTSNAGKE